MKLLALGTDHRHAPADVREAIAFDGPRLVEGLGALVAEFPSAEFAILSTCNRVEVYAAGEAVGVPATEALIDAMARFHTLPAERFERHLFDHHDDRAVAHLFRVASSLESLVLGEGQILGQVKDAYAAAVRGGRPGRSSTPCSATRCTSARRSAPRRGSTRASSRSPAWPSTWPATSSTPSPTRPCSSSVPARWPT